MIQPPPLRDEDGHTIHRPILEYPNRLRPDGPAGENNGYGGEPDDCQAADEPTALWHLRRRRAVLNTLLEPLRGIELTSHERRTLALAADEPYTAVVFASLLDRARRAGRREGHQRR